MNFSMIKLTIPLYLIELCYDVKKVKVLSATEIETPILSEKQIEFIQEKQRKFTLPNENASEREFCFRNAFKRKTDTKCPILDKVLRYNPQYYNTYIYQVVEVVMEFECKITKEDGSVFES